VLGQVDDGTQLRQTVDDATTTVAPTIRDFVSSSSPLIRTVPVLPAVDDVTFQLSQPYEYGNDVFSTIDPASSFPSTPSAELCSYAATLSEFRADTSDFLTSVMASESLMDDVDDDELDQYLSGMSTSDGDDIDLVVDEVDYPLESAADTSSSAANLASVSVVSPPFSLNADISDRHFSQPVVRWHRPISTMVDTNSVAGFSSRCSSASSDVDQLSAVFDHVTTANVVNFALATTGLLCSPEGVDTCDSSSSSSSSYQSLDALLPFILDHSNQLPSPFDGAATYYPTLLDAVAQCPPCPTASGQFIDMAALSERLDIEDAVPLPAATSIKQELSEGIEFSWHTDDSLPAIADDCIYDTTFSDKTATMDDYDCTELLEVFADVPTE